MLDLARSHGARGDPVLRQDLARYWTQVKVNGWTMRRAAAARGRLTGADGSIATLTPARIRQQSRELSYRVVGGYLLLPGRAPPLGGAPQRVTLPHPDNTHG